MGHDESKEFNQGCMNVDTVAVGCGSVGVNTATALQLSWDVAAGPDVSTISVWLIRPDGSKERINPADVTVVGGRTLADLIQTIKDQDEKAKRTEEELRQSLSNLAEAIAFKAPPPAKTRDYQQEKFRRLYHSRKK